jgi:hypothetical protein
MYFDLTKKEAPKKGTTMKKKNFIDLVVQSLKNEYKKLAKKEPPEGDIHDYIKLVVEELRNFYLKNAKKTAPEYNPTIGQDLAYFLSLVYVIF